MHDNYNDWLCDAVSELCNKDGAYEVWWDHDEQVKPAQVHEAVLNYESKGYVSPQAYLEFVTYREAAEYHQAEFLSELEDMAEKEGGTIADGFQSAVDEGDIWSDLDHAGFTGVDLMMESALRHSRIDVNLLFATKEEMNHDMCSIVESFGSAYENPQTDLLDARNLDNALSYLVNQQGYSVGDLYTALEDGMISSPFIQSAAAEVDENSSESISCLAALIATDALTYIKLCQMAGRKGHEVVLPKGDCTIGIFDKDRGGGSLLGIVPERDVVMPSEMIFDVQAERAGGALRDGYTVDQVYGLVGEAWCYSHEVREGTGPIQMEDFGEVLDAMRVNLDGLNEDKAAEAKDADMDKARMGDGRDDR